MFLQSAIIDTHVHELDTLRGTVPRHPITRAPHRMPMTSSAVP